VVNLEVIERGVTAPTGFKAAGVSCGLKESGNKDLALIYSEVPAKLAATFTASKLLGAPIIISKKHLQNGRAQAVVINSGCANTCTGEKGLEDAIGMAIISGDLLGLNPYDVAVASTGVIGVRLQMDKIKRGIQEAAKTLSVQENLNAAEAIMTTDSFTKEKACQFKLGEKVVKIGGMAKGAGMIAPKMVLPGKKEARKKEATMLAFITTDADIDSVLLKESLEQAVNQSFNRITVDGETSPNDMVLILANGRAKNGEIVAGSNEARVFQEALNFVTSSLATMIVEDAEGATKFIAIELQGAKNQKEAKKAAFAVANSLLVKTAFFGEDPNWGRIMSALGHAGVEFKPDACDIYFGLVQVVKGGLGLSVNEERIREILKNREVKVTIKLNLGEARETVWTSDLTYDYVKINAEYHT